MKASPVHEAKKMKKIIIYIISSFILIAIITGLYLSHKNPSSTGNVVAGAANEANVVRFGYFDGIFLAPFYTAKAQGLFEKNGIKLEEKIFSYGMPIVEAISAGQVDMGFVGYPPAIIGRANEFPIVIVAGAVSGGTTSLAVSQKLYENGIDSVGKLKGKVIAHPGVGSVQYVMLLQELKNAGLSKDDVSLKIVPVGEMQLALEKGDIDAFIGWEPYITKAEDDKVIHAIKTAKESWSGISGAFDGVIIINEKFMRENPILVKKTIDVYRQAMDYVEKNKENEELIDTIYQELQLNKDILKKSLKKVQFTTRVNITTSQSLSDIMYDQVMIRKKPDMTGFVNLTFSTT
jgi:NitT/TauT family transport system substrate-binding protein